MKKSIIYLVLFSLLISLAIAGAPTPEPVRFFFYFNGQVVEGMKVDISYESETITKITNEHGGIQVDVGTGSGDFELAREGITTATLSIKCGLDACSQSYSLSEIETPFQKKIILSNEPEIVIEKKEVIKKVEKDCPACRESDKDCTDRVCPECEACPECRECTSFSEQCSEINDICQEEVDNICEFSEDYCDCPKPKNSFSVLFSILALIIGGAGGAAIMFKYGNDKMFTGIRTGAKFYRGRNGELKIKHKHPGTRGYHDPNIQHRKPETHPKGMIDVAKKYHKNDKGQWEYKG